MWLCVCVSYKQFTIHMLCCFIEAINLKFCKMPWNDMKTFDNDICVALERLHLPSGSSLRTVALRPEVSHRDSERARGKEKRGGKGLRVVWAGGTHNSNECQHVDNKTQAHTLHKMFCLVYTMLQWKVLVFTLLLFIHFSKTRAPKFCCQM